MKNHRGAETQKFESQCWKVSGDIAGEICFYPGVIELCLDLSEPRLIRDKRLLYRHLTEYTEI